MDEIVVYLAPHVLGADGIGMFAGRPLAAMAGRHEFELAETRRIGPDCRLTFTRKAALMFTGIVQRVGSVTAVEARGGDATLRIDVGALPAERLALGASIAVNGVCLTVTARTGFTVAFDVSRETLSLTTLGRLTAGEPRESRAGTDAQ